jgi:hypothetical protein
MKKKLHKRKGKKLKRKKNLNFFKRIFKTQKQTCFNKEIQPNLK